MVLAELGQKVTAALASLSAAPIIDEAVLDACLKEIAAALLQADVNVRLVAGLRNNVKKRVNVGDLGRGLNKQRIIEKVGRPEVLNSKRCAYVECGVYGRAEHSHAWVRRCRRCLKSS